MKNWIYLISFLFFSFAHTSQALEKSDALRIHVMDCGHMQVNDLKMFSDTGEYDGKSGALADPCFLIQHPNGLLLWDVGLGDDLVGKPVDKNNPFQPSVAVSLPAQLEKLGLTPKDINFIAFSHTHGDHTGNANLFLDSTWLWQEAELAFSTAQPAPGGVQPESFNQYAKVKKQTFKGDYDVFGDGQVKILFTPGHTPGHQCLLVKLKGQPVILSGDLFHMQESWRNKRVPLFNVSRADTLASMARIETLLKNLHARLIIQHDPREFASLPKFPKYIT